MTNHNCDAMFIPIPHPKATVVELTNKGMNLVDGSRV